LKAITGKFVSPFVVPICLLMFYQLVALTFFFGWLYSPHHQKGHRTLLAVVTIVQIHIETAFHISDAFYIPNINTVRHTCLQDWLLLRGNKQGRIFAQVRFGFSLVMSHHFKLG